MKPRSSGPPIRPRGGGCSRTPSSIASYRESPIVASHGRLAPADPAAGDWFARRGLSADRHHLLAPPALLAGEAIRRVRVPIAVPPTDEDTLHLIRPEGSIAFRSCPADLSALSAYLDKAFG